MPNPTPNAILKAASCKRFLVSNLTNIRYLTGLKLSAGLLVVSGNTFSLFVDGRYTEMASKKASNTLRIFPVSALEKAFAKPVRCGFEGQEVTVARLTNWKKKFKNTKFVQTEGIIEEFRRQKNEEELRLFKRAQRITREMIARVPSALRTNVSERKIGWLLREWAQELGAEDVAFESIVAFGTHSSRPHHRPTDRKLKRGMLVQIDTGAKFKGYCADQSAVFFTGKPTDDMKRIYSIVEDAKDAAIAKIKAGVKASVPDKAARKILAEHDVEDYYVHALGHGVGLEVHEGATLSIKSKDTLLKNEIVTVEPGVYLPRKFGIRLEEEVIVQ